MYQHCNIASLLFKLYVNIHVYTYVHVLTMYTHIHIHIYESADSAHCTIIIRQTVGQPGDVPPRTRR